MFFRNLPTKSRRLLVRHSAGMVLITLALAVACLSSFGVKVNPDLYSGALIGMAIIITLAVHHTPGGFTSLIGLFFIATIAFIIGRPIIAFLFSMEDVYIIEWGPIIKADGELLARLIGFWIIGICGLFGGYFLTFKEKESTLLSISSQRRGYLTQCFWVIVSLVAVLLPLLLIQKLRVFVAGGYSALYLDQTTTSFEPLRLVDYFVPLLFGLAVVLGERVYTRITAMSIAAYILVGVLVGQRVAAGAWILVGLWYGSTIMHRKLSRLTLLACACAVGAAFQLIELWREGRGITGGMGLVVIFLLSQGTTFMLPALAWQIPPPPLHTVVATVLPVVGIYRLFAFFPPETINFGNYLASSVSAANFSSGLGLGSSVYLEMYYLAAENQFVYLTLCLCLGGLLAVWELRSKRSYRALFLLSASLPALFLIQRGSLNSLTPQILYTCGSMACLYLLYVACRSARLGHAKDEKRSNLTRETPCTEKY